MSRVLIALGAFGLLAGVIAQTKVDLQNQSRGVDFSAAPYTKPAKTGTALPPTCSTGEVYVLTSATPGSNFFICTATNSWSIQGSGSGGGSLSVGFSAEKATGTGSQTLFNLAATPVANSLTVWVNGLIQDPGTNYTLSGASVTFVSGSIPASGAKLAFRYAVTTVAGVTPDVAFAAEQVTATGAQSYPVSGQPLADSLMVAVNGQLQENYTISGSTITFNPGSVPAASARISFRYGYSMYGGNGKILVSQLPAGLANGIASLGADGKVPSAQLPAFQAPLGYTPVDSAKIGTANGVAALGADGKVPSAQLPPSLTGQACIPGQTMAQLPDGTCLPVIVVSAGTTATWASVSTTWGNESRTWANI